MAHSARHLSYLMVAFICLSNASFSQNKEPQGKQPMFLKDLPLLRNFLQRAKPEKTPRASGLSIGDLMRTRDRSKDQTQKTDHLNNPFSDAPATTPHLQSRQAKVILREIAGIEAVEIVETRTTTMTRTGESTKTRFDLEFTGSESAKQNAREFLDRWQAFETGLVTLEFCVIERQRPQMAESADDQVTKLRVSDYRARKDQAFNDAQCKVLTSPKISMFQGHKGSMWIANQVAYVKDFDVEIAASSVLMDPVIDVISNGVSLEAIPVIDHDGNGVTLALKTKVTSVKQPIEAIDLKSLPGTKTGVTIQVPHVFESVRKTSDLHLSGNFMAFEVTGLRALREDWVETDVYYEVIGLVTIEQK